MQVFSPTANVAARASILLAGLLLVAGTGVWYGTVRSDYVTHVNLAREQPVQFSHEHHVAQLGLDCRYCHTSVEDSSFAGIPSTGICMNCHTQIWSNSEFLAPVRQSFESGQPLMWNRVHSLPGFVFFNHSIHVAKGVGCETCHGRIDQMPLVFKDNSMFMSWCLECHREPELFLRPRELVFEMGYTQPPNQLELGAELAKKYRLRQSGMTDCITCHR